MVCINAFLEGIYMLLLQASVSKVCSWESGLPTPGSPGEFDGHPSSWDVY